MNCGLPNYPLCLRTHPKVLENLRQHRRAKLPTIAEADEITDAASIAPSIPRPAKSGNWPRAKKVHPRRTSSSKCSCSSCNRSEHDTPRQHFANMTIAFKPDPDDEDPGDIRSALSEDEFWNQVSRSMHSTPRPPPVETVNDEDYNDDDAATDDAPSVIDSSAIGRLESQVRNLTAALNAMQADLSHRTHISPLSHNERSASSHSLGSGSAPSGSARSRTPQLADIQSLFWSPPGNVNCATTSPPVLQGSHVYSSDTPNSAVDNSGIECSVNQHLSVLSQGTSQNPPQDSSQNPSDPFSPTFDPTTGGNILSPATTTSSQGNAPTMQNPTRL